MAGIYVHIPFCRKICSYCDFYHVAEPKDIQPFIEAVLKEAELRKDYVGREKISTIYFGGGTPSVMPSGSLKTILDFLFKHYDVEESAEITLEVNPDDITREFVDQLKNTRVNRISVGIQSWRDEDLKFLGRRHDSSGAKRALDEIFRAGYVNVAIDLIYGIPGLDSASWMSNLDYSFSHDIKHLSAYHLTIEPGTLLGRMKEKGLLTEIEEEESSLQYNILIEKIAEAGFIQYEISNFGKPGYFSIHNSNYWKQVTYLGLGPSAHSFNGYSRQWNVKDVNKYIRALKSGSLNYEREELNKRTMFNEYIMTSLRTMWGIDLEYIEDKFDKEGYDYIVNLSGKFIDYGLMRQDQKTLILTNQGMMISDNIISGLMLPGDD